MKINLKAAQHWRILPIVVIQLIVSPMDGEAATKNVWLEGPVNTSQSAQVVYVCIPATQEFQAATSWPEGSIWTWYGASLEGSASDQPSLASHLFTDPEGPCNITAVYNGEVSYAAVVYAVKIDSTTLATTPADRKRTTLGVGEQVTLTVLPSSVGSVAWYVWDGGGSVQPSTGTSVTFFAPEVGGSTTILVYRGAEQSVLECFKSFTTIAPTGVVMEQEDGSKVWHIQGEATVGFLGRPYIQPDYVSFYRIDCLEGVAYAITDGYFGYAQGRCHSAGYWVPNLDLVVSGKGTKGTTWDQVQVGTDGHLPFSDGTFLWNIPWYYKVWGSSVSHWFTYVPQLHVIDSGGTMTASKAGVQRTRVPSDPTSDYW